MQEKTLMWRSKEKAGHHSRKLEGLVNVFLELDIIKESSNISRQA